MRRQEQELEISALELESMASEAGISVEDARIQALVPRLILRELAVTQLGLGQDALLRYLRLFVPVLLELRYQGARLALHSTAATELDALERVDLGVSSDERHRLLLALGRAAHRALVNANAPDNGFLRLALRFPKPDLYATEDETGRVCSVRPCRKEGDPPVGSYHAVDQTRATEVWADTSGAVTFTITPEDLYHVSGGPGRLPCTSSAPVVRKMGIYLVDGTGAPTNPHFVAPVVMGEVLRFPNAGADDEYTWDAGEEGWLFPAVPLITGSELHALDWLDESTVLAGHGMSPFTSFRVDLTNAAPYLVNTSEIVFVFEVDVRPIAEPGVALEGCRF
jgi:hypothetical protein